MTCPVQNCPIKPDVDRVIQLSGDLSAAFRRLRRDLNRCCACAAGEECLLRRQFDDRIQAAISQVAEEWNLAAVLAFDAERDLFS